MGGVGGGEKKQRDTEVGDGVCLGERKKRMGEGKFCLR